MANELEITGIMKFNKSGVSSDLSLSSRVNISGFKATELVQQVGSDSEALQLGDITDPGYVIIENLDDTAYVVVQASVGGTDMIKILPGKFAGPMQLAMDAPGIAASTGDVNIRVLVVEQ